MPRKPTIKKVVVPKPKLVEPEKCDCPICPIVEYGKDIHPGDVWAVLTEPDKNGKFELSLYCDKKIPNSLTNNFNTLILFARNNYDLPIDSALQIDAGNIVIGIARPEKNIYGIKVVFEPDQKAHEPEISIYEIKD